MLQPVLIRSVGERYQLIAGERRLRASLEAQLHEIPARVLELDDQRVCELAMVENLQREDLGALEKATAFRDYLARYGGTQEELAGRLGIDRSTISNLIRLLDLPGEVHDAIAAKKITAGHARALLGLPDHDAQRGACQRIITEGLSVRQTEALVSTGEPTPPRTRLRVDPPEPRGDDENAKPPHFVELERHLHARFGTPVLIRARSTGRGQIIIPYNSPEEFDRVTSLIRG
jgi:ParB family chromosome partitioning protein